MRIIMPEIKSTPTAAELRAEFHSLPNDALVDRPTAGAAVYLTVASMDALAIKGGGPAYMRIARRALYRKADILHWAADTGRVVQNTAQWHDQAALAQPAAAAGGAK